MLRRRRLAGRLVNITTMKNTILLFLLLPLLAPAQSTQQEITDVIQEVVEENGVYYVVTTTKFSAGPP